MTMLNELNHVEESELENINGGVNIFTRKGEAGPGLTWYRGKKNDTLIRIAQRHHMKSYRELMAINGDRIRTPDMIIDDQFIRVPDDGIA